MKILIVLFTSLAAALSSKAEPECSWIPKAVGEKVSFSTAKVLSIVDSVRLLNESKVKAAQLIVMKESRHDYPDTLALTNASGVEIQATKSHKLKIARGIHAFFGYKDGSMEARYTHSFEADFSQSSEYDDTFILRLSHETVFMGGRKNQYSFKVQKLRAEADGEPIWQVTSATIEDFWLPYCD